jgi:hypothetical protein
MWACNTFGDLRIFYGISTSKTIEDLSKENDIHVFVGTFHLQVTKKDGNLYSPMRFQVDII